MRERDLAFFIAHGEIIPAAVFEIADAGDAHAIAVDERSRHHRHFRPPGAVMRGLDATEPYHHARKSAAKTAIVRGVRETQRAQTPKVKKTSASTRRASPTADWNNRSPASPTRSARLDKEFECR